MARLVICRARSHHIPSVNRNTSTVFFGKVRPHICMVDSPSNVFSSRNPIVSSGGELRSGPKMGHRTSSHYLGPKQPGTHTHRRVDTT